MNADTLDAIMAGYDAAAKEYKKVAEKRGSWAPIEWIQTEWPTGATYGEPRYYAGRPVYVGPDGEITFIPHGKAVGNELVRREPPKEPDPPLPAWMNTMTCMVCGRSWNGPSSACLYCTRNDVPRAGAFECDDRRVIVKMSPTEMWKFQQGSLLLPMRVYFVGIHYAPAEFPPMHHVILGGPGLPDSCRLRRGSEIPYADFRLVETTKHRRLIVIDPRS